VFACGWEDREYQNNASGYFLIFSMDKTGASPWCARFSIFKRADRAVKLRERNRASKTRGGRMTGSRLHAGVRTPRFEPAAVFAPTGVANWVEVSLSSFRQPLVSGCIKADRSRPAGIPYLNRQCLLPDTAIALLENQPGRPCPNPDAPPRRRRALYGADALGDGVARCCGRRNSSA
jgi:hypothetical protein